MLLSLPDHVLRDAGLVNIIRDKFPTNEHDIVIRCHLLSRQASVEILHIKLLLIHEPNPIKSVYSETQFIDRKTHPKLTNHPDVLVREHPPVGSRTSGMTA
jgi:hypothetical protein